MPCFAAVAFTSSQYPLDSAAFFRSNSRASQLGICTPLKPSLRAQAQIESNELKGGLSPAYCARKIAGPLMVVIAMEFSSRVSGRAVSRCVGQMKDQM